MKTQKNTDVFEEFCMMNSYAKERVDYWYDGRDFYEVVVVLKDGSAYLYDACIHGDRRANSVDDLFKLSTTEEEWKNKFAINLYLLMRHKGYTQASLAKDTGISQASICKYTNGDATPSPFKIRKLANALGCDEHDLMDV